MPLLVERNVYSLYRENKLKVSNIFEDKGEELVLLQRNGGKLKNLIRQSLVTDEHI